MKIGEVTKAILDIIGETSGDTNFIFDIFFTDYATSYGRLRGARKYSKPRPPVNLDPKEIELQRFYRMLWSLKKQGLIIKSKNKWVRTSKGRERCRRILERWRNLLPRRNYNAEPSEELKLVIFDIPEKERRKRVWLRSALNHLGFKRLQKSVWDGKVMIPEEFLNDLRKMHLLQCVEIFAITKTGSLRELG